jgi:hypothetical protein
MSGSEENPVNWRPDARAIAERLRPVIERVEGVRKMALEKHAKAVKWGIAVGSAGGALGLAVAIFNGNSPIPWVILALALLAGIITYSVIEDGSRKTYRAILKREVFAAAAAEIAPGMRYLPEQMVSQGQFKAGGLFNSRIDRYEGGDYFTGKVGATDLFFSELHVQRKETTRDSKGRSSTRWVTVFRGIYLVADFHKEFRCHVEIVPDVAEAHFGWLGRKLQGFTGNLVRLGNPEFERAFKVTSDDDVGAHYLLTPEMQERFLALRNQWSDGIRAALLDSFLHLAIPMRENWFEAGATNSAGAVEPLQRFLDQLVTVLHITEMLDLNTRIWTKE